MNAMMNQPGSQTGKINKKIPDLPAFPLFIITSRNVENFFKIILSHPQDTIGRA